MARFLVIDTDGPHIALMAASGGRGTVKIENVHSWTLDAVPSLTNAEAIGLSLRAKLAEWKIAIAPLIVAVGRERVVFKEIKFPAVPAHEEPAVVRFQAIKELTEAAEEVIIDYQARPSTGPERRALVVAAKKEVVRISQLVAQHAGLKLHAVIPRPFALAAVARAASPSPEPGTAYAVLAVGSTGGEFLVARGEEVLFARPVATPSLTNDTTLISEVRRNLAIHSGQNPQAPVKALYVAEGTSLRGFADRVRTTFAVPVHNVDPLAGTGLVSNAAQGQLAAAAGLARLALAGEPPINFIKPHEPKPVTDPHRRPLLTGAAIAAVIVLLLGSVAWMQISAKDREIASLRSELDGLSGGIDKLLPNAKRADEVNKWLNSEVVWLDELYDLAARFPDLNKLRITQLTADPIALPPNAKPGTVKQHIARVAIEGLTTEDGKPLSTLMSELAKEPAYRVEAKNTKPLQFGPDRRTFSSTFTTRYELEKRQPDQYTRTFTAEAPARKSRGGTRPSGGGLFDMLIQGGVP